MGFALLHDLSHERRLDSIKRSQETKSKVVNPYPDRRAFFYLDPRMSLVEIVALWDPATSHFHDLHGPHDGLDRVLVVEDLIEFAPAALIIVGAELEFSLLPHVLETRSLGRGQ